MKEAEAVLCALASGAFCPPFLLLARKLLFPSLFGSVSAGLCFLSLCSPCPPLSPNLSPRVSASPRMPPSQLLGAWTRRRRWGEERDGGGGAGSGRHVGIGAREGGKEGGRRARGREQRAARGAAGASAARPSRLLRLSVRSARARGGMGWPGGSPCCCPAPPRPRPAGRPPQVSGREAPGGRAAACTSRRGGQCRWWSPGGAGPLRGANGRGERSGRARSGVWSPGPEGRGRQRPER